MEKQDKRKISPPGEPLLEEQLSVKLRSYMGVRRLMRPPPDADAEKYVRLHLACTGGKIEGDLYQGMLYIQNQSMFGLRINVLDYFGEPISLPGGERLSRGDWVGHMDYKMTGHVRPNTLAKALEENRAGKSVKWADLLAEGFMPNFASAANPLDDAKDQPVGFLVFTTVLPHLRGMGLVDLLLKSALDDIKALGGTHAVAYARLPGLKDSAKTPDDAKMVLDDYLQRRDANGFNPDWGVRFHQKAGGRLVCGIPDSAVDDKESLGQGALILYDLV
jgi:hypothetical protein